MILKSFEIPLYRGNIIVVVEHESKEVTKIIPSFKESIIYAHTYFDKFNGCQGFYLIFNFHNEYRNIKHGVIAHECLHAANMISYERGLLPDFNNDEPLAYLVEWINDCVYSVINENNLTVR